ncbi:MAG: LysM peptidoglycan-binding domain-containing protein, partial [Proteobacteria bacterium]|nr:LysM peptidoglycan-binding domain-containing protein [Pseudomonadota bacterium]
VRPGDNLSMIAERLNVPLPALMQWNKMDMRKTIHPGDRLVVSP